MRQRSLAFLFLLCSSFAHAGTTPDPVLYRGTHDGAYFRFTGMSAVDLTIQQPDIRSLIVTADNANLKTSEWWPKSKWVENVKVFGSKYMGPGQSRVKIKLRVSTLEWRLEEQGNDTLLILFGATQYGEWLAERRERREDARVESQLQEAKAREERLRQEDEARQERIAQAEAAAPAPVRPAAPAAGTDDALRRELQEARLRLERLERQLAGNASAPSTTQPTGRTSSGPPPRNVTARRRGSSPGMATPVTPPAVTKAAPLATAKVVADRTGDGMVRVAAGSFVMGTAFGSGYEDEIPEHVVNLGAYAIDEHEVTVREYQASPLTLPRQPGWNLDSDNPVVNVTYHEAAQYCSWAGKRLPTEAQWEKAARGPQSLVFPWGNQWNVTKANSGLDGDGFSHTAPVGSFPAGASVYGAQDMSGNVWEWVRDWYDADYYRRSASADPTGPLSGSRRLVRGGSFVGETSMGLRGAVRQELKGSARRDNVGFRCAR